MSAAVHSADIQDRDGAAFVLDKGTRARFPFIARIYADAGYQGPKAAQVAASSGDWVIEVVKRNELHTLAVLSKRCVVERSFAWLEKCRRLWKNCERKLNTSLQMIHLAFLGLLLRRS